MHREHIVFVSLHASSAFVTYIFYHKINNVLCAVVAVGGNQFTNSSIHATRFTGVSDRSNNNAEIWNLNFATKLTQGIVFRMSTDIQSNATIINIWNVHCAESTLTTSKNNNKRHIYLPCKMCCVTTIFVLAINIKPKENGNFWNLLCKTYKLNWTWTSVFEHFVKKNKSYSAC